jgi:hypothetical protein
MLSAAEQKYKADMINFMPKVSADAFGLTVIFHKSFYPTF